MATFRIVYDRRYNIRAFGLEKLHPFDSCKYGRAWKLLRQRGVVEPGELLAPQWPSDSQLLRIHTPEYLARLDDPAYLALALELPVVARLPARLIRHCVLRPMRWAAGGTLVAARAALEHGAAVNLSGGYHHARQDHGHGFCIYADVAIAIHTLRGEGKLQRVMIVDLDAHQGDGPERIYSNDPSVAIYDLYNADVFPGDEVARRAIRWNLPIEIGTADREYLGLLTSTLAKALDEAQPELVFYNAGTDIVRGDPVGLLDVSPEGVLLRDRFVFEQLTARRIPWVMVLSGGYTPHSYELVAAGVEAAKQACA